MREVSREWLEFLREQYPKGSRVRLTKMGNDPHPIPPGSMGTLKYIDDVGQFHVKWDNGRGLALIIGEDQFQILPPEPQTIKFYMPLTAQLYAYDDWGDLEEYGNDLDGSELRDYQSCIHEALLENQMPEEKNRGLMHWYDKPDGVNTKVQSVMLDVESRDGQLWGVAECKVNGTLLPEEKEALAEYISGQASDGWGEGFEQRAIKLNDGELYVYRTNTQSYWLAQHILNGIVERVGTRDNGVRINPSLFVLRRTTMPAALVELAYLSNWEDAQKLRDDQWGFAWGIYQGLLSYFGFPSL